VAQPRVRRARDRYPHLRFHDVPIWSTDFSQQSADLIVMDNVVEHLPDPLATLRAVVPYLAQAGRLVIITPNMESGHYRLLGRRWTPELAPHAHIYLFTRASLTRLMDDAGLAVSDAGAFHEPGAPVSRLVRRLLGGDVKGFAWRGLQEAGGLYGRLIGAGPMLYVVARRRAAGALRSGLRQTTGEARPVTPPADVG
jgi:hypothetical protein